MPNAELLAALKPLVDVIQTLQPNKEAKATLEERFALDSDAMQTLRRLVRAGIENGSLCDREAGGVRFSRVQKAAGDDELSIDAVHMRSPGPGHTHPNGEFDLCFAVEGAPTFDGAPEGWTVYGPGSWHVPTVEGGVMDILYFLPGGAIRFEDQPAD